MKIPGLVAIHHPHWRGTFVVQRHMYKSFIEKNEHIWDKYNMDPDLFIIEDIWIKDDKIENILLEGLPELFL